DRYFKGSFDETRISSVARSSNWVWTCWMNQKLGSTYMSYGSVVAISSADYDGDGLPDATDPDDDNDGMSDVDEILAGTDPLDQDSVFQISELSIQDGSLHLEFQSVNGRMYSVEYKNDLTNSTWLNLSTNISGDGSVLDILDTLDPQKRFYRLRLQ
ncbi:MAG: hypothetical protein KAH23_03525, partial [Kiritimatiellae bacterium]|nr:hypothetical protein [Kiritimatiellia bacterium]